MEVSFAKMKAGSATTSQSFRFSNIWCKNEDYSNKNTSLDSIQCLQHLVRDARASAFMSKVMGAAGVIGIIIMVIAGLRQLFKNFDRIINAFKKLWTTAKKDGGRNS